MKTLILLSNQAPEPRHRRCVFYALVEVGDHQAVDVLVRREDAFAALEATIKDEPDCGDILCVCRPEQRAATRTITRPSEGAIHLRREGLVQSLESNSQRWGRSRATR